jgi:hypothetical protein
MGQTNLKHALERKYALLAGELKDKQGEVAKIQTLFEQLPTLSSRTQRIERLLECAEELLKEIDPAWAPTKVKAVRPNVHKAPVEIGRISKTALDVMRQAGVPLTISEITDRLLAMEGVGEIDPQTRQRVRNSVDSTLRQKARKNIVANDGAAFARKWNIVSRH